MLLLLWFVIGGLHHSGTISTVTADRCDSFEFSCANGRCIPDIWRCNGFTDCTDGSDETSCPNHSPQGNCTEDEFLCNTSRVCITKHWFCDGDKDCDDGSDEPVGCSPPQKSCPDDGFLCAAEGNCLPSKWKCDGSIDCSDGSDENDCHFPTDCILVRGHFRCYSGHRCLNGTSVCNGKLDCDDGSDEGANCSRADCKTAGCEHGCFVIPEGRTQCFCRPGFELQADGRTCTDVDECEEWGTCSQTCTNVPGSFTCSCQAGYFLKDDNRGCSARGPDPVLLFSFQSEVHGLWLRTDRMEQIAVGDGDVYGVAFDGLDSKVYWTYSYRNRGGVSRKSLYGSLGIEQIVTSGILIADDIDFDWISRNIYFVDSELKHIAACSLEGMCVVLVDEQMDKPRAIKLDPVRSRMIWTDWGRHARIDSAGMDGSGRSTLVSDGLVWPNGLAIDFATSRIFWSDAKLDKIESVRYDGSDRKVLPHVLPRHPFSLAVFEDSVFWSDWELDAIHSCNKFTGKNTTIVLKESDKTYLGISVYHPVLQQNANNPCSGSRCSDVCLLSPTTGHVCRCGKGRTMTSNSKDCVEEQTHSYMVISQQQSLLAYYTENFGKDYIQRLPTSPLLFVGAIAYTGNNEILVSDNQRHRIFSYDLATRRETTLVQHHLGNVVAVTWDAMRGNMFWADSGRRMVEVWTNRSGTSYRRELATDILHLLDLTCYSLRGWLFYSTTSGIFRLNMDGTGLRKLINDVVKPTSVAVDADLERLFWCDSEIGSLGSIRLDGTDRQAFKHYLYHPYSVTLTEFHVFWTDLHTRDLHWADKLNPDSTHRKAIEMPSNLTDPIMKVVYVDRRARLMRNASQCERMHCSQLCLVTEGSKEVCQCRTGMRATAGGSCAPEECHDDQFTCNDGACIASEWRCDGEYDCTDGEDELCPTGLRRACNADEFMCISGECVIGRCNGDKDCADGSDEEGCAELQCDPVSQFRCAVGPRFCLPLNYRCDNVPDCTDSSDEMNCDGNCTDEQFRCTNGLCIQKSWECDGRKDCVDGSDEHSECVGAGVCTSRQFKCENGYCVDVQMLCDGNDDCTDGSDETQCPGPSPDPRVDAQTACGNELFWCHLTMEEEVCVPLKSRCNGTVECPGEEDELDCPCVDNTAHFHCRYINRCISRLWLCDGENDCGDNSDERGCSDAAPTREPVSCRKGQYQCDSGECVDVSLLCNDISDCADHSDETGQCDVACRPEACAGSCQPTPTGPLCSCSKGLVLGEDGRTCLDVDECQDVGQCSQWCHNTFGSFKCSCDQGYRLEANGKTCRATGVPAQLLYTSSGKITMMSVRDGTLQLIKRTGKSHVQAVDYNLATGHVYWSDEGRGSVKRVETSDGSTDVVLRGLEEPDVIAHDWITGNVYVAENGRKNNTIKVCANFKKCRTLFNDSVSEFSDIALVPQAGAMVWCTHSLNPGKVPGRIERWTMDGLHGKVLVNTKILSCRSLAVDFVFKRIYWSDPFLQTIKSVDWDGRSIQGLPIQQLELPTSLTLLEDQIYFVSGIARNEIKSCNKFTGQNCSFLMFTQDPISDVIALQDSRQPRGTDPCPLKKCKEVCALKPGGATCLASDPASTKQSVLVIPGEHPYKLCPSNKCKNGGTCVQENGNLKCLCPPGLAGVVCERDGRNDPKEKSLSESQTTADADGSGSNTGVTVALVFVFVILPLGIGITWFVCKRLKGHHVGRFASIVHFRNPSFGLPHQEVLAEPSVDMELNNNAKKTNSHTNPGYEDHRPPAWQIGGLNLSPSSSSFDSAFVSTQGSLQKPSLLHENSDEDLRGTNAFGPVNFHERLIIQ